MDEPNLNMAIADALYRGAAVASDFIGSAKVRGKLDPIVERATAGELLWTQLLRIDAWLRSLKQLDNPGDYQAVSAGARSVLESSVDIALLANTPSDHEVMRVWEESAKFKHAECLLRYCTGDQDLEDEFEIPIKWAKDQRTRIEALRRKYGWVKQNGKTRHPDRWTDRDLASDAREADKTQSLFKFERFYETRYRELCWATHGSGMVGVRDLSASMIPYHGARAYRESTRMALVSASLVLEHFQLWNDDAQADFDEISAHIEAVKDATLKAHGFTPSSSRTEESACDEDASS